MVDVSPSLIFGIISNVIGTISVKFLHPKKAKSYIRYKGIFYISIWLTLLIGYGLEYYLLWSGFYAIPFLISVLYLAILLLLVIFKKVELKEE